MKKFWIFTLAVAVLGFVAPAYAGGKGKEGKHQPGVFEQYDKNSNGVLDPEEKDAIKKDFEKDPNGPLKAFDTNSDGKLSDEELAAIQPAKKHKKKKDASN
jgi:EF hand